jgi:ATP synthase protein I
LDDGGGDKGGKSRAFFRAAQFASLGLEMGLAVAIGAGFGWFLDSRLGTAPWLLLVFLLFGVAAGFKGMISAARRATTDVASNPPKDDDDGSKRSGTD